MRQPLNWRAPENVLSALGTPAIREPLAIGDAGCLVATKRWPRTRGPGNARQRPSGDARPAYDAPRGDRIDRALRNPAAAIQDHPSRLAAVGHRNENEHWCHHRQTVAT